MRYTLLPIVFAFSLVIAGCTKQEGTNKPAADAKEITIGEGCVRYPRFSSVRINMNNSFVSCIYSNLNIDRRCAFTKFYGETT